MLLLEVAEKIQNQDQAQVAMREGNIKRVMTSSATSNAKSKPEQGKIQLYFDL
jgi:hypothetical protein